MQKYCPRCGASADEAAQFCNNCRSMLPPGPFNAAIYSNSASAPAQDWRALGADKKITAGILGILIGGLGIHKFVLGYKTEGLIMLLGTLLTCGFGAIVFGPIGLVEGILYLVKSDEEFVRTYLHNKRGWF